MLSMLIQGDSRRESLETNLTGAWTGACSGAPCSDQPLSKVGEPYTSQHCHCHRSGYQTDHSPDTFNQSTGKKDFQIQSSLYTECSLDTVLIQSFRHLLKMYSMHVNPTDMSLDPGQDSPLIVTGGLQQYLIRNMKKNNIISEQPRRGAGSTSTTFHDLPDSAQLEIFSYLAAKDLCVISMVCRHWYCVASDNVLWKHKLEIDIRRWDVISHATNPQLYLDCQSDWTSKEIYLRCSPAINLLIKKSNINFHNLSNILRTFLPKKTPRIAMFGPGLESSTSAIARKLLEDQSGIFKTTGMFPGQFEGLGSGFTMKMGAVAFHLLTLYTSSKQERESRPTNQRLQHSRLIAQNPQQRAGNAENMPQGAAAEEPEVGHYEVRKAIKDLCQTLDGFIFVVDATQNTQTVCSGRAELHAMIDDQWVSPDVPVAIISCVPDPSHSRPACINIVSHLQLSKLSRPWQVRDCVVEGMSGVTEAIEWVVAQAQRSK